ncbi:hypothetical protein GCM10010272_02020 [Streptomyces lateritius]|nr:hypothetical protein GCM10010272_02020 [Streptomyces lateritius]
MILASHSASADLVSRTKTAGEAEPAQFTLLGVEAVSGQPSETASRGVRATLAVRLQRGPLGFREPGKPCLPWTGTSSPSGSARARDAHADASGLRKNWPVL